VTEEGQILEDDDDDAGAEFPRHRSADLAERPLSPTTLIGSYFMSLEDGEIALHGMVVAEVQGGVYLFQLYGWEAENEIHQILFKLPDMIDEAADWRFFDTLEGLAVAEKGLAVMQKATERG
jgi:hypothetical protein